MSDTLAQPYEHYRRSGSGETCAGRVDESTPSGADLDDNIASLPALRCKPHGLNYGHTRAAARAPAPAHVPSDPPRLALLSGTRPHPVPPRQRRAGIQRPGPQGKDAVARQASTRAHRCQIRTPTPTTLSSRASVGPRRLRPARRGHPRRKQFTQARALVRQRRLEGSQAGARDLQDGPARQL